MASGRLKHFGWGREGEGLGADEEAFILDRYRRRFTVDRFEEKPPPALDRLPPGEPGFPPPPSLARLCSSERHDRAQHTYGKSYQDTVRGLMGDYADAPDVVAYPESEADVAALID